MLTTVVLCAPLPWPWHSQGLVALAEALSLASNLQVFLLWGNKFGPSSGRAFLDTLGQSGMRVVTDVKPYEVDGVAQVALMEVD